MFVPYFCQLMYLIPPFPEGINLKPKPAIYYGIKNAYTEQTEDLAWINSPELCVFYVQSLELEEENDHKSL